MLTKIALVITGMVGYWFAHWRGFKKGRIVGKKEAYQETLRLFESAKESVDASN